MSKKYERETVMDALSEAWDTAPEMSLGTVISYILMGEDPQEVSDEEFLIHTNDFILHNM